MAPISGATTRFIHIPNLFCPLFRPAAPRDRGILLNRHRPVINYRTGSPWIQYAWRSWERCRFRKSFLPTELDRASTKGTNEFRVSTRDKSQMAAGGCDFCSLVRSKQKNRNFSNVSREMLKKLQFVNCGCYKRDVMSSFF